MHVATYGNLKFLSATAFNSDSQNFNYLFFPVDAARCLLSPLEDQNQLTPNISAVSA